MAESKRTKKCRFMKFIFGLFHLLCLLGPFIYFIPYALVTGAVVSKITLTLSCVLSLILGAISLIVDQTHRSSLHRSITWILIAGILFCLASVKEFIWIMAISSILDELIFTKIKDHYAVALISNKEIDRRG